VWRIFKESLTTIAGVLVLVSLLLSQWTALSLEIRLAAAIVTLLAGLTALIIAIVDYRKQKGGKP
jgi:hypothetical protein